MGQGDEVTAGQIPFTPRAKKVLELSLREALALGHNYIGTEHVLLGLMRENEGVAARILLDFEVDLEKVQGEVISMLGGRAAFGPEAVPAAERAASKADPTLPSDAMVLGRTRRRFRRMPRGRIDYARRRSGVPMLMAWLLFGVALGIGILLGWLIWG